MRDKLDRVGIKLHLKQWELLTLDERRRLRDRLRSPGEIAAAEAAPHVGPPRIDGRRRLRRVDGVAMPPNGVADAR